MHLNTITELLNLQNYKAAIAIKTEDRIYIVLERVEDTPPVCSGCGKVHGRSVHSRDAVIVEDLRMLDKRVFLTVPKRKIKCFEDNKIRVEEIPWLRDRVTDRFAEQVAEPKLIPPHPMGAYALGFLHHWPNLNAS